MYKLLNELGGRGKNRSKDGGKLVVGNWDDEQKAWKTHFQQISEGRGSVNPNIWKNIKKRGAQAAWLSKEPSDMELDLCLQKMKSKKAAGKDGMVAEAVKYGGTKLKKQIFETVKKMWTKAATAEDGEEADCWPKEWKEGVTIPLWKNKGSRADKNTYRGITLLSIGSKLLARVISLRLQTWADPWLHELQCGFRRGRGTDDVLQISRRVIEEVVRAGSDEWVMISFFDIEKAYPRV